MDSPSNPEPVGFVVLGVDHPHGMQLTFELMAAGGTCVGWAADTATGPAAAEVFAAVFPDLPRLEDLPTDLSELDLTDARAGDARLAVIAAAPGRRGGLAVATLRAGMDVLVDKPGATTTADLHAIDAAVAETGRRWWVAFTEHLTNRAVRRADRLVAAGRIGTVRHVLGLGPHRRGDDRPSWFGDRTLGASIINDLASHQVHHAARLLGTTELEIVAARTAGAPGDDPAAWPEQLGELMLAGGTGSAYARVDWLTPDGLPTWGDVRLMITGDHGTIEVRANIDPAGRDGGEHLIVTDRGGVTHLDCAGDDNPWAAHVLRDVVDGTETELSTSHGIAVTRLCIEAAAMAGTATG